MLMVALVNCSVHFAVVSCVVMGEMLRTRAKNIANVVTWRIKEE